MVLPECGTTISGSLPAGPLRPGGRLPASAKVALSCLLWFVFSFCLALWGDVQVLPVSVHQGNAPTQTKLASAKGNAPQPPADVSADQAEAAQRVTALLMRALPMALPLAQWRVETVADTDDSTFPEAFGDQRGMSGAAPGNAVLEQGAGRGQSTADNADLPRSGESGPNAVQRITVTGECAPLRLGLVLLEALRDEEPIFQNALARPSVRWTSHGTLEVLLGGRVSHSVVFPGREGDLADLGQPLPEAFLVLVLDDMGQKLEAAEEAVALPFPVALAIWPHSPKARETAALAASRRRDCLLHQPMEALPRPDGRHPDPGPGVLLANMAEPQMRAVLEDNLRSLPSVLGLNNHMGSAFTGSLPQCRTLCALLRGRGLAVLDSVTRPDPQLAVAASEAGLTNMKRDVFLDTQRDTASVSKALDVAAARARAHGYAIAIGHPHPETLRALREWQDSEGVAVVPLRRLVWKLALDAAAGAARSASFNNSMDKE